MSTNRIKSRRFLLFGTLVFILSLLIPISLMHTAFSQTFVLPCTITTSGNAWNGEIAFGLWQTSPSNGPVGSYLVVMKTDGTVEYLRQSNASSPNYEVAKNLAQNTLMFQGEPIVGGATTSALLATHLWNYVTNTTVDYPNVIGHHDIEYNPINNTFLTLQEYVKTVNGTQILFDKIVELDASGNILWSWDTYDHIPLSEADPFGPTASYNGSTVMDFTHSNALEWDYNSSVVYLNCRHINTFYKINQTTSNLIWACGEYGNFTLLAGNGTQVPSLWYHSHGTYQVSPNVFVMFDNDFDNETNPTDCQSRMIELTLNEQNMSAWVSWNWTAPKSYWSFALGNTARLPNGDHIGVFGVPSHQRPENQPWDFNDTGAVMVEVNQTGSVVRTWTFPVGWAMYRVQPLTFPTVPLTIPENIGGSILLGAFALLTGIAAIEFWIKKPRIK